MSRRERQRPTSIVDASALLALLLRESGGELCRRAIGAAPLMSAVNWSEVSQKARSRGVDGGALVRAVSDAGLGVVAFDQQRAEATAALWAEARRLGLSLADRACIALAVEFERPAITADRSWMRARVDGLSVQCIR